MLLVAAFACAAAAAPTLNNGSLSARELAQGYREGTVLAKPRAEMLSTIDQAERAEGLTLRARYEQFGNVRVLGLAPGDTVMGAVARLRATGRYEYVEPDYVRHTAGRSQRPRLLQPVGAQQHGRRRRHRRRRHQRRGGLGHPLDGPAVIIAILDSGALTTHQDLDGQPMGQPEPGNDGHVRVRHPRRTA